jgi:hypothetical protein
MSAVLGLRKGEAQRALVKYYHVYIVGLVLELCLPFDDMERPNAGEVVEHKIFSLFSAFPGQDILNRQVMHTESSAELAHSLFRGILHIYPPRAILLVLGEQVTKFLSRQSQMSKRSGLKD